LSAKHASGEALSMEASREFSRTPRRLPPCSDVSVLQIPGTCVQYPGLQGGGALGDALTLGTPAGSIAASGNGGTYSHVAVAGIMWGGERGSAAATAEGGGPPVSRDAQGRGPHSAAQRTCARRAGRPTRRTSGRVGPTAARRGAFNRAARRRQKLPTSRRNRSRRAGTITRGSSQARRTLEVAARGRPAQLGAVGGGRGTGAVRAL